MPKKPSPEYIRPRHEIEKEFVTRDPDVVKDEYILDEPEPETEETEETPVLELAEEAVPETPDIVPLGITQERARFEYEGRLLQKSHQDPVTLKIIVIDIGPGGNLAQTELDPTTPVILVKE
jgi:hypothetical protein